MATKKSLRNAIINITAAIILFVSFTVVFMHNLKLKQEKEVKLNLNNFSYQLAEVIKGRIQLDVERVKTLAVFVGLNNGDLSTISSTLENTRNVGRYSRIVYINENFELNAFTENGYNFSQLTREGVEGIYNELSRWETVTGRLNHQNWKNASNVFFAPVYSESGKNLGMLIATIDASNFESILKISSYEEISWVYVVDSGGTIIAGNERENSDILKDNIFEKELLYANADYFKNQLAQGLSGSELTQFEGEKQWITYKSIGINDWYLVSAASAELMGRETQNILSGTYAVLISLLILFIALTMYIFSQKTKNQYSLAKLAFYDEQTGIFNRDKFVTASKEKIINATTQTYAVVLMNIVRFKIVNEIFGFEEGNKFLKYFADVISAHITDPQEIYGRENGAKFALCLKYSDNETLNERINAIVSEVSTYEFVKGEKNKIEIDSGVYVVDIGQENADVNRILDHARLALKQDKTTQSSIIYYDEELKRKIEFEAEIEHEMFSALENNEFVVYYQPKYKVVDSTICGAEALVRWQHPQKGFLFPDRFIGIFERNGFIIEMDMDVLRQVCKQLRRWIDAGIKPFPISVNQSRLHLFLPDYIERITATLDEYNVPRELIELEITESVAIENLEIAGEIVSKLHDIGITVSLDDFGSGYSSLNLLKDIKVDILKLDREFFMQAADNSRGRGIIESIMSMTKKLGIYNVSEGIETQEQFDYLKSIKGDIAQGYLFSRPVPLEEYEKLAFGKNFTNA